MERVIWVRGLLALFCLLLVVDASRIFYPMPEYPLRRDKVQDVKDNVTDAVEGEVESQVEDEVGDLVGDYTDDIGDVVDNATETVLSEAEEVLGKYKNVFIGACIPIGLLGCLFGYYLFMPFMFCGGFVMGSGFFYFAVKATTEGTSTQGWLTIVAALLGGLVVGVVAIKAISVGIFIMGSSLGATFGLALRHTMLYSKIFPANPKLVLYAAMGVLAVVFGFIALCMEKEMVIIATSFGGAFGAVYGIGHFAGHFPDLDNIEEAASSDIYAWIYLGSFVILGCIGCLLQFRITSKGNERASKSWFGRPSDDDEEDNRRTRRNEASGYSRAAIPESNKGINLNVMVNPNAARNGESS